MRYQPNEQCNEFALRRQRKRHSLHTVQQRRTIASNAKTHSPQDTEAHKGVSCIPEAPYGSSQMNLDRRRAYHQPFEVWVNHPNLYPYLILASSKTIGVIVGARNKKTRSESGVYGGMGNHRFQRLAEDRGFEPLEACAPTDFKSAAFDRSASPPRASALYTIRSCVFWSFNFFLALFAPDVS